VITLQAPLWLILLGLIPIIHWLHRFRQHAATYPTTTLFLWQASQQESDSDAVLARPDPRWLLRALIATLVILSLSQPSLKNERGPVVEIWVDDSLSMFAREDERTRIQTAMEKLHLYLAESQPSRILVHSLGNPATQLVLETDSATRWLTQLAEWTSEPRGEPSPPPPATLSPGSNHILLTDGADSTLNNWALSTPLHRVIQIGRTNQNIALTRLSLRGSLHETRNASDHINGLVRIDNLGDTPQQIRLVLQLGDRIIGAHTLDIPASDNTITTFVAPSTTHDRLDARIESTNDALPMDDRLELDTDHLHPSLNYQLIGSCSLHITAALDAHPTLTRVENQPDMIVDCSGQAQGYTKPTLRLHPPRSIQYTTQFAHWHNQPALNSLRLAAGLPYSSAAPAITSSASPILSADGRMLILKHEGADQTLDSYLDISNPAFARQPEFPLLMLGLIDLMTSWSMDNYPLTSSRASAASRITPSDLSITPATPGEARSARTSLVPVVLIAATLLLVLDAVLAFGLTRPVNAVKT
jgi:hypothetical protein